MDNARWIIAAVCALVLIGGADGQETSESAIRISGQILDPVDAVFPNTSVTLKRPDSSTVVVETKTDERGRFQILAPPAQNYELHIAAAGFKTVVRTIDARRDLDIGQVVLQLGVLICPVIVVSPDPDSGITGRVYDSHDSPVENATVRILSTDPHWVAQSAKTSAVGSFGFDSLPKGAFTILIESPGFLQRRVDVKPEAQRDGMDLGKIVLKIPDYLAHGDRFEWPDPSAISRIPIKATACELTRQPVNFNGQLVEVRATITAREEASVLTDSTCAAAILLVVDNITRGSEKQVRELAAKLKKRTVVTATIIGLFEDSPTRPFGRNGTYHARLLMQSVAQISGR